MPGWARPTEVHFDHAAAAGAVEAVAALRFVLSVRWSAESAAAEEALTGWQGLAADAFAASLAARRNATGHVIDDLLRLQTAIELAAADAVVAQRRIDALQAEWDAERRAEVRARREAASEQSPVAAVSGRAR